MAISHVFVHRDDALDPRSCLVYSSAPRLRRRVSCVTRAHGSRKAQRLARFSSIAMSILACRIDAPGFQKLRVYASLKVTLIFFHKKMFSLLKNYRRGLRSEDKHPSPSAALRRKIKFGLTSCTPPVLRRPSMRITPGKVRVEQPKKTDRFSENHDARLRSLLVVLVRILTTKMAKTSTGTLHTKCGICPMIDAVDRVLCNKILVSCVHPLSISPAQFTELNPKDFCLFLRGKHLGIPSQRSLRSIATIEPLSGW